MKRLLLLLILFGFAGFSACTDDPTPPGTDGPPSEIPPGLTAPPGFEPFYECWGEEEEFCISSESPSFLEFIEVIPGLTPEVIASYLQKFGMCEYFYDDEGVVRSVCNEEAVSLYRGGFCPSFFLDSKYLGAIESRSGEPNYCLSIEGLDYARFSQSLSCPFGSVNLGFIERDMDDENFFSYYKEGRCVLPEHCAFVADREWPSREGSCFYGDFTAMETGVIPPQDCDALGEEECAVNCDCATDRPDRRRSCRFLSEERPAGVCLPRGSNASCREDNDCNVYAPVCVRPANLPPLIEEWVAQHDAFREGKSLERPINLGFCAPTDWCASLTTNDDGFLQCGDGESGDGASDEDEDETP